MPSSPFRPTFLLASDLNETQLLSCIQDKFDCERFCNRIRGNHGMVEIKQRHRHFWSPFLTFEVSAGNRQCEIRGRFSPHPTIWTAFTFSYLAVSVVAFFSLVIGVSQQLAQMTPCAYWALPICGSAAILLWFVSRTGQKLARAEMVEMYELIKRCCEVNEG